MAGPYENTAAAANNAFSARNNILLSSVLRKVPVEVVVEEDNGFVYTGTYARDSCSSS